MNTPDSRPQEIVHSAAVVAEEASQMSEPTGAVTAPQVIIQNGGGFLMRLFAACGWAGFILCLLMLIGQIVAFSDYFDTSGGITERFYSGSKYSGDKVAVLHVSGVIMDGHGFTKSQIDRIRTDTDIKAVVIRVNSPGGTITGSDYIYHHLKKLREERDIPLVVSMGSIAASGGYYVSMAVGDQEKSIYAEPTTTTGSIGVIIPHYDVSGLMARFDVKDDSIASHPRKQMLSMTRPIAADHREILQRYIDEAFGRFKEIVKSGRPKFRANAADLDALATGEIFTATQAHQNGLVDEIGFIEDAIDRAIELAGLEEDSTRVIRFQQPVGLLDLSGLPLGQSHNQRELATLLELSTPRGYYLATSLPPLVASYSWLLRD